jgi:hypothetical protein
MPVCSACGAELRGPFCWSCGARAGAGGPTGQPGPEAAPPPAPYPPKRRTSPLVWLLIVVLSVFILAGLAAGAAVAVVSAKTGLTFAEIARDPPYAAARMGLAVDGDYEEISHAGREIIIRNRRTGKTATLRFDDLRNGTFRFSAGDEQGKSASLEIGSGARKVPSWVPVYPGAEPSGGLSASGDDGRRLAEGGTVVYTTPDPVSAVAAYYEDRARISGMQSQVTTRGSGGGVLVLKEQTTGRHLTVLIGRDSGHTTISLTYAGKE